MAWLDNLYSDIRFALRSLRRSPAFAIAAISTLALGLGANAAVFSLLNQLLFQPPAGVTAPGKLRRVWTQQPGGQSRTLYASDELSYHAFRGVVPAIADQFDLALYTLRPQLELGRSSEMKVAGAYVTSNYFSVLGIHPDIGRTFTAAETDVHSGQPVVMISQGLWRTYFGEATDVVGRSLTISGREFRVVGVASRGFSGVDLQQVDVWLPLGMLPTRETARVSFWESSVVTFSAIGRLRGGANEAAVEARATNAYRAAPVTDFAPSESARLFLRSINEARGLGDEAPEIAIAIRVAGVALLILLITTANVINLLLARAVARRRESGIRLAMGISRLRLARLFIVEAVALAVLAAAAAAWSAQVTGGLLRSVVMPGTQFGRGPVDATVVSVTMLVAVALGVLSGLVPAFAVARNDLGGIMKQESFVGSKGRFRVPSLLVSAQVALSVVLLFGAVIFVASLRNIQRLRIGYDTARVAFASVVLPSGARVDTQTFSVVMRTAGGRVAHLAGVEAVAFAREQPMTGFGRVSIYASADSLPAADRPLPTASYVSADYFKAVGTRLLAGESFTDDAATSANSIVINRAVQRAYLPGREAVGQCIHLQQADAPCLRVVGVVEDAIRERPTEPPAPQVYLPIFASARGQRPPAVMIVRSDPARMSAALHGAEQVLREAFPRGQALAVTMEDRLAPRYRPWRLGAFLFGILGALALAVAGLGVFGSVSYFVAQRLRELGIRIALGATPPRVLAHVMRQSVRPVLVGGLAGAMLAIAGGRLVASLVYGISATDVWAIAAAVLTLSTVGIAAAFVPAMRATHIDPVRIMVQD